MRFKRPCAEPGCPEMVEGGRCERHARKKRQAYDARRGTPAERGYDAIWRKVRRLYLRRHPNCERCMTEKRMVTASVVHHIDRDSRNNADSNLESLCRRHHELEHAGDRTW